MPKSRILVIDDEAAIRDSLRMTLEYEGYEFRRRATGQEGLALAEREAPDLVLLDVKMPGMDGLEVLDRLRAMNETLPVVVISGHGTISTAVEATKKGAFDFIEKPFASERVLVSLRNALDQRQLRDEKQDAQEGGRSPPSDDRRERRAEAGDGGRRPRRADQRDRPDSGRERRRQGAGRAHDPPQQPAQPRAVRAGELRRDSRGADRVGAVRPRKGSFTGATEKQVGKFEQADRGTIFLDEVGDMSAKTQAKVLRVLQEGEVERLGSARTIKVDVRVIAATNKNLEEEIEKGRFREDLYFRLAVIPIYVPPLRERPEDIPLLVRHYMDYFSRENNVRPKRITQAALDALTRYRWKGNIRELRNTVERLNIMTSADTIDVAGFARTLRSPGSGTSTKLPSDSEGAKSGAEPCASSRTTPSARSWSASCARTAGTSRRPPK